MSQDLAFRRYLDMYQRSDDFPISQLLPVIFRLKGKPYSLDWSHFMFEPFFKMKNKPRKLVVKSGRQVSKCVAKGTLVRMADGSERCIETLSVGDTVLSCTKDFKIVPAKIINFWDSGIKPTALLYIKGVEKPLVLTLDHRVLVNYGEYKELKYLDPHDKVCVVNEDISWNGIVGINSGTCLPTYDIEVEDHHSFIANGIVTHNSTSQGAMQLLEAATTPYFNVLTVMPLFEQVRKFSQNTVRPFIVESPYKNTIFKGSNDSVLQRTLVNGSSLFYSYTGGSGADRMRGIQASCCLFDECLAGNTLISTPSGLTNILDLNIGDLVYAFDESSNHVVTDRVINIVSKGKRPLWRLSLDDGSFLDCTDNERIWTPTGWIYLSEAYQSLVTRTSKSDTDTARSGEYAGGHEHEYKQPEGYCGWVQPTETTALSCGKISTGGETAGLFIPQSRDFVEFHKHPAKGSSERRLRNFNISSKFIINTSIRFSGTSMLQAYEWSLCQDHYHTVVGSSRIRSHGILDNGRRICVVGDNLPINARIYRTGSRSIGRLVDEDRLEEYEVRNYGEKDLLLCCAVPRGSQAANARNSTANTSNSSLQDKHTLPKGSTVFVLRPGTDQEKSDFPSLRQASLPHSCKITNQAKTLKQVEINSITYLGLDEVYDIETESYHTLFANGVAVHNCQDLDIDDIPVIESTMGASPYKISRYTGTPKSFDNPLQKFWEDSSQGVWHIPCKACNHENRCNVDGDLIKMIGKETLVCGKCSRPVNSRLGYYIHANPGKRTHFAGYHVPQVILPMHYESPKDWFIITEAMEKKPKFIFYNEFLGESFDIGTKLITMHDIKQAAIAEPMEPHNWQSRYFITATGVDWGGRGREKTTDADEFISNTAIAVAGMRGDGVIEIPWMYRVPYDVDHFKETKLAGDVAQMTLSKWLAMDYGGQGNVMEELVIAAGYPRSNIVPFTYSVNPGKKGIVFFERAKKAGVRNSYVLDKPRSILLLCELIKTGQVVFANKDEYINSHLTDFFSIYLETKDNPRGPMSRLVHRMSKRTDDIVHAINFAVMALYHTTNRWPLLAESFAEINANS